MHHLVVQRGVQASLLSASRQEVSPVSIRIATAPAPRCRRHRPRRRAEPKTHRRTHGGAGYGSPCHPRRRQRRQPQRGAAALTRLHAGAPPERQVGVDACTRAGMSRPRQVCSGSRHHHFGSSSSRSGLLISSVRRRNCPGNRPTAQPSPNGRRGSRKSPGGNRSPKHSWFSQTAVGTTSPLSINP